MDVCASSPLLRVGCAAQCGWSSAGGHLVVEPGAVRFECGGAMAKPGMPRVIHARPPLVFVRARLLPPGSSSGLVLHGDQGTVTVFTWFGLRSRVRRALVDAEVAFFERVTWLSIGVGEGASAAARVSGVAGGASAVARVSGVAEGASAAARVSGVAGGANAAPRASGRPAAVE